MTASHNPFGTSAILDAAGRAYRIQSFPPLERQGFPVSRQPYSLKILLKKNLLRHLDGAAVTPEDVKALAASNGGLETGTDKLHGELRPGNKVEEGSVESFPASDPAQLLGTEQIRIVLWGWVQRAIYGS